MNQRKRLIVDPTVQWSIARRIMVHWALFCVTTFVVYTAFSIMLTIGEMPLSEAILKSTRDQLPMLVTMILLMPIFLRDILQLSQRFTGPIYRLRGALKDLAAGESPRPLRFRDGDFWSDVAGDFNLVRQKIMDAQKAEAPSVAVPARNVSE